MIKVNFFGQSIDLEIIELQKMEVEDAFLLSYPSSLCELTVFSEIKQYEYSFTNNWKGIEDIDEDVIKKICNNHELKCSILNEGVVIKSYSFDVGEFIQSNIESSKDIDTQVINNSNDTGFTKDEKQEFLDTNQQKIKPFEVWVKENEVTGMTKIISFIIFVVISYFTLNYISDSGFNFYAAIGIFVGFVFLAPIFNKKDLSKKAYHMYVNEIRKKDSDTKIRRKQIEKNVNQLEIARIKTIDVKKQQYFRKIDCLESNFNFLKSIDLFKVGAFKSNIAEYENQITTNSNSEALQKFVRVSKFLSNIETHLDSMRESMIIESKSINIRNVVLFELGKSPKQLEKDRKLIEDNQLHLLIDSLRNDTYAKYMVDDSKHYKSELERVDKIIDRLIKLSEKSIDSFEREVEQLKYLETMANSMIIFLIEDKKVLYFEILEFFDGLGALDSAWEKRMQSGIEGLRGSLEKLSESMTGLENSVNRMTAQNDLILKELASIDSTIKFGNLIQTITAYNTYKIKKNISSNK